MPLRHTYFTPGIVAALLCSLCSVPSVRGQERLTSTASNSPLQTEFENRSLRPGTDMRDAYLRNPALIHRMVGERRYFRPKIPGSSERSPVRSSSLRTGLPDDRKGIICLTRGRSSAIFCPGGRIQAGRPGDVLRPDRIYGRRKRQRRLERTAQSRTVLALHCCRFDGRRLPL